GRARGQGRGRHRLVERDRGGDRPPVRGGGSAGGRQLGQVGGGRRGAGHRGGWHLRPGRRERRGAGAGAGPGGGRRPRSARRPRQQRGDHGGDPAPRPRRRDRRGVAPHPRRERARHVEGDPGGGAPPRGERRRVGGQHHLDRGGATAGQLHPLRGVEGRPQPPDRAPGQHPRSGHPGQRRRPRPHRHPLDRDLGRDPCCGSRDHPAQALGPAGGRGRRRPRTGALHLHHRRSPPRRRRHAPPL
ncbi:MAG: 3-oxoacyl-[acyl-carrier protein] reductase, partial [uncultured Acidimicrobiales bacterium]